MNKQRFNRSVFELLSVMIIGLGFVHSAGAGVIGTGQMIDSEIRHQQLVRAQDFLARRDVAAQLADFGLDSDTIAQRLQYMTDAELAALDGRLGDEIAGADALGVIGTVFLVLLILELVGVTDIFKAI